MSPIIETIVAIVTDKPTDGGPMEPALDIEPNPEIDLTVPASGAMAMEEELLAQTTSGLLDDTIELCQPDPDQAADSASDILVVPLEEATRWEEIDDQGLADALPLLEVDGPTVEPSNEQDPASAA